MAEQPLTKRNPPEPFNSGDDGAPQLRLLEGWGSATTIWFLSGLLAALAFSLGFHIANQANRGAPRTTDWLSAFAWTGGGYYTQIAAEGYRYNPDEPSNIAFFPVYPLLAKCLMAVTGLRAEAALLMVSNASLLAALATLVLYVRRRYLNAPRGLSGFTVLAATLFPTGCFFRLAYTESTFLFLSLAAMYGMLRGWSRGVIAVVVGLATATRPVGVALLAPFAIYLYRSGTKSTARRLLGMLVYLPIASWGLIVFAAYQHYAFGDALASVKVQKHWGVGPVSWGDKALPLLTLQPIRAVYDSGSPAYWQTKDAHGIAWLSLQFANPIYFLAAIALIVVGTWQRQKVGLPGTQYDRSCDRWLSLEEATFAVLLLLIPYGTRGYEMDMGSMGRFVSVVFPIHLVLGQLLIRLRIEIAAALLALSGFLSGVYLALYAARHAVF